MEGIGSPTRSCLLALNGSKAETRFLPNVVAVFTPTDGIQMDALLARDEQMEKAVTLVML